MKKMPLLFCCLVLLALTGCRGTYSSPEPQPLPPPAVNGNTQQQAEQAAPWPADNGLERKTDLLENIQPNELGKIMVLMYHEIGERESTWARTWENFRLDMETLYQEGYRPVNLNDVLQGKIDVPAGTTPFILTFDDGAAGQFRFIHEGGMPVLDPNCAVAILLELGEKYPDFNQAGTFYIYYPLPFRQREYVSYKLQLLVEWGFEIGNHTFGHENLAKVSREEGIKSLARHVRATAEIVSGYQVKTLALPYGARPADDTYLIGGEWDGISYQNDAILLVGANPSPSPFDRSFNPFRLPRIRADEVELARWLDYFRSNPEKRYVSDGDPKTVTVPETLAGQVDREKLNALGLQLKLY